MIRSATLFYKLLSRYLIKTKLTTTPPIFVFFGPRNSRKQFSLQLSTALSSDKCHIIFCEDWLELESSLKEHPIALIIHVSYLADSKTSVAEFLSNVTSLIKLKAKKHNVRIAIAIELSTSYNIIKEAIGSSVVKNIVPCTFSFGTTNYVNSIRAILHNTYYCPTEIISLLPEYWHNTTYRKKSVVTVALTPRQTEIASIICNSGLSNKHIARTLGISESSVKFHLSKIFKKHNVSNRLQLTNKLLTQKRLH